MHPITEELEFDESELFSGSGKQDQHCGHGSDNESLSSSDSDDVTRSRQPEPGGPWIGHHLQVKATGSLVLAWLLFFGPFRLGTK